MTQLSSLPNIICEEHFHQIKTLAYEGPKNRLAFHHSKEGSVLPASGRQEMLENLINDYL